MELNKFISFGGVTETAFHAIFRRCLLTKIYARFLDPSYIQRHIPNSGKYGLFPRQPDLKPFLRSAVAVAAGLMLQHGFESLHNEEACRDVINEYVLRGGDGGLTEKHMRQACGLPPVAEVSPEGGHIAMPAGVSFGSQEDVRTDGEKEPMEVLRKALIEQMLEKDIDSISLTVFARLPLPLGVPAGKRSDLWERLEHSPAWIAAPTKGAQKKALFPRIRTEQPYERLVGAPGAPTLTTFQEMYDADALTRYASGCRFRKDNVATMCEAFANCREEGARRGGARKKDDVTSMATRLETLAKKLKDAEGTLDRFLEFIDAGAEVFRWPSGSCVDASPQTPPSQIYLRSGCGLLYGDRCSIWLL